MVLAVVFTIVPASDEFSLLGRRGLITQTVYLPVIGSSDCLQISLFSGAVPLDVGIWPVLDWFHCLLLRWESVHYVSRLPLSSSISSWMCGTISPLTPPFSVAVVAFSVSSVSVCNCINFLQWFTWRTTIRCPLFAFIWLPLRAITVYGSGWYGGSVLLPFFWSFSKTWSPMFISLSLRIP